MSHKKTFITVILTISIFLFSLSTQCVTAKASDAFSFVFLSKYYTTADIGNEFYIIAITSSGNLPNWKSSDSKVASVNTYGKVTAKKPGAVRITAKIDGAEASCKVTVNKTKITVSATSASIERGQTFNLFSSTSNKSQVTWKSSRTSIATVDENGKVTGIKPGETTITATADGSTANCKIKVKAPTVTLSKTSITLYRAQTLKLSASVSSGYTPTWKTDKKSVAVVDENGTITAIKHGVALITATVDGVTKTCKVTVERPIITLSSYEKTIKKGTFTKLTATVSSGNSPQWSSSSMSIATVDTNGKVTAIKKGTTLISAYEDGTKVQCIIHVTH